MTSKKQQPEKNEPQEISKEKTKREWTDCVTPRTRAMIEDRLVKGEKVIALSRIHIGIYWKAIAVLALALVIGFLAKPLGVLLFVASILTAIYASLRRQFFLIVMTDKRIFVRTGLLMVEMVDINYDRIESFELEQMLPGYLMGYATVVVMGTGNRYIYVPYVGNARSLRKVFSKLTLEDAAESKA